ncbi:MAG: adenosylcobinamide-phosphate synthase CbiB [Pontiella sp.]
MNNPALILLTAFVLDLLIGDPVYPFHPARLMGQLIQVLEKPLRKHCKKLTIASNLLPLLAITVAGCCYGLTHRLLGTWAWLFNLYLTYSLLALGDLLKHAHRVEFALKYRSLEESRQTVQWMVGRDTAELDAHGVARAAIESVAENFVDGFLSPFFWFVVGAAVFRTVEGGVLLMLTFKVVSTLDSMVGYKNAEYRVLGRISAKLDDVLNFIPARLSIPLIAIAAKLTSNDWRAAWAIGLRDRLKHASPNSAHAEASVAGALGLRLGGPSIYDGERKEKSWLGDGSPEAGPANIERALRLIQMCGSSAVFLGLLTLI